MAREWRNVVDARGAAAVAAAAVNGDATNGDVLTQFPSLGNR